ncbi:hypothetical protein GCM10010430_74330 [Kitasatospora cystarginea]|uniref:Uncharacterized protein n=1 Tax=Kitasatospora cystarginea TaxID=58350 RepID=A0ABN3EZC4_9ACTN
MVSFAPGAWYGVAVGVRVGVMSGLEFRGLVEKVSVSVRGGVSGMGGSGLIDGRGSLSSASV